MGTQGWQTEAPEPTMPPPWVWAELWGQPGSSGTRGRMGKSTPALLFGLYTPSWGDTDVVPWDRQHP